MLYHFLKNFFKAIGLPKSADARFSFSLYLLGKFLLVLKDELQAVWETASVACKSVVNVIFPFTEIAKASFLLSKLLEPSFQVRYS